MSQRWRIPQFLLGVEGLALLRRWVTGDAGAIDARIPEIEELCRRFRDPPAGDVIEIEEVDPASGYDAFAASYDHVDNSLIETEEPPMRGLLDTLPVGRVLDAACGTGRYTAYLAELGHTVSGMDVSAGMLRVAAQKTSDASFAGGDLNALPVATDSHDAAVCSLALTHLPDLGRAVGELARVVRPGGDVVTSDIHPLAAATGAHVVVMTDEGRVALVRNHFHSFSRYLEAFAEHTLDVVTCVETPFDAHRFGSEGPLGSIREATAMALDGLPFVLLWHLRVKPRSRD